ncbi:hypothetical protein FRB94_006607 [Tulasnella sp. JGI-2019a]|nr:hypothetical protein FRB94_006607 [Tulasnella sp. JGI-2019a]KAG9036800.1 hypothetical protein FRB95_007898 [Tulasnella sp. JGI-2019a]
MEKISGCCGKLQHRTGGAEPKNRPTAAEVVDRTASFFPVPSLLHMAMEIDSSVSSDNDPAMFDQLSEQGCMLDGWQSTPLLSNDFHGRANDEPEDYTDGPNSESGNNTDTDGHQGHYNDICTMFSEEAATYEGLSERCRMAEGLRSIGDIKRKEGHCDESCTALNEAAVIFEELGDQNGTAHCLKAIGGIQETQGYDDDVLDSLNEAYVIFKELGD